MMMMIMMMMTMAMMMVMMMMMSRFHDLIGYNYKICNKIMTFLYIRLQQLPGGFQ